MTSSPPAEPRPPPPPFPSHAFGHNPSSAWKRTEGDLFGFDDIQNLDDRPAKRRKISVDNNIQTPSGLGLGTSIAKTTGVDQVDPDTDESFPLPARPWQNIPPKQAEGEPKQTHRARSPISVPTSPDTTSIPESAPRLSNKKYAAYFPWSAKHAEDELCADHVKQGFHDRPPNPAERETNTARVPLYNALKHRSGVESLSTLFSLVLEAKSRHGLLSSASTFKPPPRVTLAEAKRRSWVTDLADVHVPLRRLSRTIPQGIRGQGLLDQCIQNDVPLSRAIWFAKCVGANEIRTLKRKGTPLQAAVGTESKWLREWTVNAEHFVESILAQVGHPKWKANIQYALRLATRLYLENLVDRDHYLDWIVKSFTASPDERLPFWLMVVHIYKQDITKFRKRGRILAEGLIQKYTRMREFAHGMTQALVRKLRDAIRGIALHRSHCFLIPDQWPNIKTQLTSCLDADVLKEASILQRLDQVNERCMGANKQSYLAKPSDKDKVIEVLDATEAPYDPLSLSQALREACPDHQNRIHYCLEWATTPFRYGNARVYLIARLLRRWLRQGTDVNSVVLQFLASVHNSAANRDLQALKHIISDLSRSQTFSVTKYLEWLNVRGLPHRETIKPSIIFTASEKSVLQQKCTDPTQTLMDLSTTCLSEYAINSRNALLHRAGFDDNVENDAIKLVIAELHHDLKSLAFATQIDSGRRKSSIALLLDWNWNVRSRISHWLRSFVTSAVKQVISNTGESLLQDIQLLSRGQFEYTRTALETLGDEAVLADVVGMCSSLHDEQLQACLVETISRHAKTFSAIGALEPLQLKFCQAYLTFRGLKPTMPLYATALLDLCSSYPCKYISVNLLQQDLIRGDRGRAMAACSPFSDGIAESLQQAEDTFIEQFEGVLQSEPSMHEQTMNRLFSLLTERIEKQQGTIVGEDALFNYCQLMARLRWCRRAQGDLLLQSWLIKALAKYAAPFTGNLVYSLTGTGCLTMDVLVEAMLTIGRKTVISHHGWLVSSNNASDHACAYTTTTKWLNFGDRKPQKALRLLGLIGESQESIYERQFCIASMLERSQTFDSLEKSSRRILSRVLDSLLDLEKEGEGWIGSTLQSLSVFSSRFVQVCLNLHTASDAAGEIDSMAKSLVDLASDTAQESNLKTLIPTLLETGMDDVGQRVRQMIEESVLEILPRFPNGKNIEGTCLEPDLLRRIKGAVHQAFALCPQGSSPSVKSGQRLVDVLLQIVKCLGDTVSHATLPRTPSAISPTATSIPASHLAAHHLPPTSPLDGAAVEPSLMVEYLRLVLQLLCLQRPATALKSDSSLSPSPPPPPPPPPPPKNSSDNMKILAHLTSIITHPALSSRSPSADLTTRAAAKEVTDFAYDVMATYVDDLSDEGRAILCRILRDKLRDGADGRLNWLFGAVNTCGSDIPGGEELGKGLLVVKRDSEGGPKGMVLGEWRPKVWEVLETGGRNDTDVSVGLGMFGARRL